MKILTIENKPEEKILRQKMALFDFAKFSQKETDELVASMRAIMKKARGVGLAANQIGLNVRVFTAQISNEKFYAIFNPKIVARSHETITDDEGCLSVPEKYGSTERAAKVTLQGFDKNGRPLKIKAFGLLARIFQHEVDHLDGKLFIDRANDVRVISDNSNSKIEGRNAK